MPERPARSQALAELLRREMSARGMTNGQLAEVCGASQSLVSRWRNGVSIPQPRSCTCIAETFGLDPNYVLRMAGHLRAEVPEEEDPWRVRQREWSMRFDLNVRRFGGPAQDDCTERTIDAWLDGFSLMVDRLRLRA
jgi:transcriptional regulator with XRE-family HTH domain